MKKVLIWGLLNIEYLYNWITEYEDKGEYTVVGCTAKTYSTYCYRRFKYFKKDELCNLDFEYVMILANKHYTEIKAEAMELGIPEENIFPGRSLISYGWNLEQYLKLQSSNISILAQHCWGSCTYHNLALRFNSPLINMWEPDPDFINIVSNIDVLMKEEPRLLSNLSEQWGFPVFELNGNKLMMSHYTDPRQALEKWNERKNRINKDNIFVLMTAGTPEIAERFAALPYDKKMCFTTFETDIPCAIPIPKMQERVGYILGTADGKITLYNPYSLLLDGVITNETESIF